MGTEQRIGQVLPRVLRRAARQRLTLEAAQRAWKRLVGRRLAEHTRPVSLGGGRLIVHVEHPGDGFALSYQRPQLLEGLRAATKGKVTELVIRAGDFTQG